MNRFTTALLFTATVATAAFAKPATQVAQPPHADMIEVEAPTYDRATVRAMLAEARARNLAAFHAYATAGVYPSNVYTDSELNVWRDQAGHFCAAATIIRASGETALVIRVAEQNNNIKLADVTAGPLMNWILTSGLTQDEIALIQRPFRPVTDNPQPAPVEPMLVDAKLRAAETARLKKLYAVIERRLAREQDKSLDAAADRLMKHAALIQHLAADNARHQVDGAVAPTRG